QPKSSKILIPRNKVDLDNINEVTRVTQKMRDLNTRDLDAGESLFDIDYLGARQNRDFHGHKDYNYDYKSHSNGFLGTYMEKLTNNFTLGTAFSYNQADVKYGDIRLQNINVTAPTKQHSEKIDSFNTQMYGRYEYGLWNLDLGMGYGVNNHKLDVNYMSGMKQAKYKSYLLKTGGALSYEFPLTETLSLVPLAGLDYLHISEDKMEFNNKGVIVKGEKNGMLVETVGLSLRKNIGKFRYDAGIKYQYNTKEALHNARNLENYYINMEALKLDRHTMIAGIDMQYALNELVGIHGGYSYRYNKNYQNNNINLGINIKFANTKELAITMAEIPMEIITPILNLDFEQTFKFDSAEVTDNGVKKVHEFSKKVENLEGTATVEGHTDSVGNKKYNEKLSKRRAEAIGIILEKDLKDKTEKINIVKNGLGEESPLYPNDTEENRKKNRVVKIKWKTKE
ncbi:MAG: autotransporter domain-containing protein, partial [Psychrilyobacter sp.]|uniref:autotransporter domain-containing protein n=1 Tax=Psychrilyobacter sp. TaxID=2586924 RepID=UPI003C74672A